MNTYRILNLGAGVQSTTVALMGLKNWQAWSCSEPLAYEPVGLIDYAIFADTQGEPEAVYRHLDWLEREVGGFIKVIRVTKGSLEKNLIAGVNSDGGRFVAIPSFLAREGQKREGIGRRQCTQEYKIEPIEQAIRRQILGLAPGQRVPAKFEINQLYGLSYDEAGRIARVKARREGNNWHVSFPLFELEMTRRGCKSWLAKHYPGREVPRSACVFCPYHSNHEWRAIRDNDPQGWQRAISVDAAIRLETSACTREAKQYLHRDCVPLGEADLASLDEKAERKGQLLFGFNQECEGMCGV